MIKRIKTNRRKGFTLIELIVVMAVLAILVLLAAPKFLGQTKEATFTKHLTNAKVMEDASERYYIDHGKWPRGADADVYTAAEVDAYADKIYDITGEALVLEEGKYWDIDYAALDAYAKLPDEDEQANYVLRNPVGTVYYLEGLTEAGEARLPVAAPTEKDSDPPTSEVPAEKEIPDYYVLATDADFTKDTQGYWRYTGTDEYVIIPHEIGGVPVTSYAFMFSGYTGYGVTPSLVKGVVSTNPHVTDMRFMFHSSQATTLDLSSFDTANVTSMYYMFYNSKATTLDLSSFNTAKVTDMSYMFYYSQATTLDLSNFDTAQVTDMRFMFASSQATTLDLSSFNTANVTAMSAMFHSSQATTLDLSSFETANVTDMRSMFFGSKATTLDLSSFNLQNIATGTTSTTSMNWRMFSGAAARTGYARTTAVAAKLNNFYTSRPTGLTFIVKP